MLSNSYFAISSEDTKKDGSRFILPGLHSTPSSGFVAQRYPMKIHTTHLPVPLKHPCPAYGAWAGGGGVRWSVRAPHGGHRTCAKVSDLKVRSHGTLQMGGFPYFPSDKTRQGLLDAHGAATQAKDGRCPALGRRPAARSGLDEALRLASSACVRWGGRGGLRWRAFGNGGATTKPPGLGDHSIRVEWPAAWQPPIATHSRKSCFWQLLKLLCFRCFWLGIPFSPQDILKTGMCSVYFGSLPEFLGCQLIGKTTRPFY